MEQINWDSEIPQIMFREQGQCCLLHQLGHLWPRGSSPRHRLPARRRSTAPGSSGSEGHGTSCFGAWEPPRPRILARFVAVLHVGLLPKPSDPNPRAGRKPKASSRAIWELERVRARREVRGGFAEGSDHRAELEQVWGQMDTWLLSQGCGLLSLLASQGPWRITAAALSVAAVHCNTASSLGQPALLEKRGMFRRTLSMAELCDARSCSCNAHTPARSKTHSCLSAAPAQSA